VSAANIVHKMIDHPTDPSHPPLIGLFSGDSGVTAGVELRWDYYNRNPQRGTPHTPSVGEGPLGAGSTRYELARDPATGRQHLAHWTTWDVLKVSRRQGNERSCLTVDDVEDGDDGDGDGDGDDDDDDDEDDGAPLPGLLSVEQSAELHAKGRVVDSLITRGGRWEIPSCFWQCDPPPWSNRTFELAKLANCPYWEPVPLVGFSG
jgi:hypothetical protein